jgi:hypothetical protein
MPIPNQIQGDGPIEFLSTPPNDIGSGVGKTNKATERPGMRRTASDSAATALEFASHSHSHSHQSRSPTPPLLDSLKSGYIPLEPLPQAQGQGHQTQAGLLASVALAALVDSPHENVQRALGGLKLTRETLLALQPELSSFFGRFCLEKEMGAVSLEVSLHLEMSQEMELTIRIDRKHHIKPLLVSLRKPLRHSTRMYLFPLPPHDHLHRCEWTIRLRLTPRQVGQRLANQHPKHLELDHSLPPRCELEV